MLDSTNIDPDFLNTIITADESWVNGYDPEPVIFLTMKILKKSQNTTTLKCYLTLLKGGEKNIHAYEGSKSPHASAPH
jgi:hypothetical protein